MRRSALIMVAALLTLGGCGNADWVGPTWKHYDNGGASFLLGSSCGRPAKELRLAWPLASETGILQPTTRIYLFRLDARDEPPMLGTPAAHVTPPADVRFSGYRRGNVQLWFADSDVDIYVYLHHGSTFDRWARSRSMYACM